MARKKCTLETVRAIVAGFPKVEEGTMWGVPAFKIRGNMMACVPSHRSAEPDSFAVRIPFDQRADLLAAAPDVYYAPEHYVGSPIVLVRLSRISEEALRGLLRMGYDFAGIKKSRAKRREKR